MGGRKRILRNFEKESVCPDCLLFSPVSEMMRGFFMSIISVPNRAWHEGDGFFMTSKFDGKPGETCAPDKVDATDLLMTAISGETPKSQYPGCERIAGGVAGVTVS